MSAQSGNPCPSCRDRAWNGKNDPCPACGGTGNGWPTAENQVAAAREHVDAAAYFVAHPDKVPLVVPELDQALRLLAAAREQLLLAKGRAFGNLNAGQVDGWACVYCGADFRASHRAARPVGVAHHGGGQVFACSVMCTHEVVEAIAEALPAPRVIILHNRHELDRESAGDLDRRPYPLG